MPTLAFARQTSADTDECVLLYLQSESNDMLWAASEQAPPHCLQVLTAADELDTCEHLPPSHRLICSAVEWLS